MRSASLMKRLSASIPDRVYEQLEKLAEKEGRSVSNLVAYMLEKSIERRLELYGRIDIDPDLKRG